MLLNIKYILKILLNIKIYNKNYLLFNFVICKYKKTIYTNIFMFNVKYFSIFLNKQLFKDLKLIEF